MELTHEMILLLTILGGTVLGFVFEIFRVDIIAILAMIALGITGLIPGAELFSGFAQNAVISIMAVMIIGAGLDKVGIIQRIAQGIMKIGGSSKKRIIPMVSGSVGIISSFMQNIGAAALFLPVLSKISAKTHIPLSQLLMPMGFCAIIGGTITMVGSSPLILLNGLISAKNESSQTQIPEFGLFDVTPIGITLMIVGIAYFVILGKYILPNNSDKDSHSSNPFQYFSEHFGINGRIFELDITEKSPLLNKTLADLALIEDSPKIIGLHDNKTFVRFLPSLKKHIRHGASLAVIGESDQVKDFAKVYGFTIQDTLKTFRGAFDSTESGIAEIILPHTSLYIGRTLNEVYLPSTTNLSILSVFRNKEAISHPEGFGKIEFKAGDTLLVHGSWQEIAKLDKNPNAIVASDYKTPEDTNSQKTLPALFFFGLSLFFILMGGKTLPFTPLFIPEYPLALSLLMGAIGMILSGVIGINQAYRAIDWKTIFLLASLFPMGMAMSSTGTAEWIAIHLTQLTQGIPLLVIELGLALLTTFFTLVMSNVGATVLLVPLAIDIALQLDANPAVFALIVGISASNSFILPTHQVNALIMGPAGYRVKDFLKAGGIMTLLFLVISTVLIHFLFGRGG